MTNFPFVLWILRPAEGWVIHDRYKHAFEAYAAKGKLPYASKVRFER